MAIDIIHHILPVDHLLLASSKRVKGLLFGPSCFISEVLLLATNIGSHI